MLRTHRRKSVLAAAALVATTMLLTACQGEGTENGGKSTAATTAATASAAKGKSDDGGSGTGADSKSPSGERGSKSGMVSGKWVGTVSYLAPGKYTVTGANGVEQAFFTSEDTDIEGAGKICGDADGQAATPCTEEELEAAAKKGFKATVDVKNGVAVSIIEEHTDSGTGTSGGNGMGEGERSGLFSGTLGYMAPGKYSLSRDGDERAFFTATDTVINGAGWICGDAETITPCTEEELEAAAKKGSVAVVVQVENGVAVTIDEEHN
ncbi:lipoprotein [Streptomyces glaucosporus]|uniref:Lipoprotein n=1 Tax=Streptomyces glaucosporus TaxID=284044 RepID=A0ABP5VYF4_9ACTN